MELVDLVLFRGGGDGVVATLQPWEKFKKMIQRWFTRGEVFQHSDYVSMVVHDPTFVRITILLCKIRKIRKIRKNLLWKMAMAVYKQNNTYKIKRQKHITTKHNPDRYYYT